MINLPTSVLHPLPPWKKCPTRAFCWTCLPRARAPKLFPTSPRATSMSSNDGWMEDRTQMNLISGKKKMKPLYMVKLTRQTSLEPHLHPNQPTIYIQHPFRAFFSPGVTPGIGPSQWSWALKHPWPRQETLRDLNPPHHATRPAARWLADNILDGDRWCQV